MLQLLRLAPDESVGRRRLQGPRAVRVAAGVLQPGRRELEHELIPLCLDQGVGVLVWGPLASGLLARSRASQPHRQTRLAAYGPEGTVDSDAATAIVATMSEIAADRDVSLSQVALNWLLAKRAVTSVIVGARDREQLTENLAAATWKLDADELQRLDDVSQRPLPYPYFHQVNENSERMRDSAYSP